MLIYQMTHKPTQKLYIGALKDSTRWEKYNTSSKVVRKMMKQNPEEWDRQILFSDFNHTITWPEVVSLEQALIKATAKQYGWDKVYNKAVYTGQVKLAQITEPWNKGKQGVQVAWNKGLSKDNDDRVKSYAYKKSTENMKGNTYWIGKKFDKNSEEYKAKYSEESINRRAKKCRDKNGYGFRNGPITGTHIETGVSKTYYKASELIADGFVCRMVLDCVRGVYKKHRLHTWKQ